jgi:hypothetical protein
MMEENVINLDETDDQKFMRLYKITDSIIVHLIDIPLLSPIIGACIMDAYVTYTLTLPKDPLKIIYTGNAHTKTYCKFLEDIGYKQLYSQSANSENNADVIRCQPVSLDFQKVVNFDL